MDLPDLAELDDLLDLLPDGTGMQAAQTRLRQASSRFRAAVHHPVSLVTDDEVTLDGDGSRTLLLPAAPVIDVESVTVDGTAVDGYRWSPAGVLRRDGRWPDRPVTVVYSHGHDPIPDEIQEAVLSMAVYLATSTPGVSMMQVGSQMVQTPGAMVEATVTAPWDTVVAAYRLNRGDTP